MSTTADAKMIQVAPEFQSDAEYDAWLQRVHEEIPNEGENNADYRQEGKD